MEHERFDRLARALAVRLDRRSVVAGLVAATASRAAGALPVAARHKKKPCAVGLTKCGDRCRDLQTDPANCGACGTVCPPFQGCQGGACYDPCAGSCAAGEVCCGTCTTLASDALNCGACGKACAAGLVCVESACVGAEYLRQWAVVDDSARPEGVAFAPNGDVYVADPNRGRVLRYAKTGELLGTVGSAHDSGPYLDGQFDSAWKVAVAPNGEVYVTDPRLGRVQVFSATGEFLRKWGSKGSGDGQFNWMTGVALSPDGQTVYIADSGQNDPSVTGSDRVQVFNTLGEFQRKWGRRGSNSGQLDGPRDLAVAPNGNVHVLDSENQRVQVFTPQGGFVRKWGSGGSLDGRFLWPSGVAVAADGTVYVADSGNQRIQRFSATGQLLAVIFDTGSAIHTGSGPGEFNFPQGVAVAPDGTMVVADERNHRVQEFLTRPVTTPATRTGERQRARKHLTPGTGRPGSVR